MFEANLKGRNFLADYSEFSSVFTSVQRKVEEEAKLEKLTHNKPRSFGESEKSKKNVGSMIVSDNDAKTTGKSKKENKKSVKIAEEKIEEIVPEEEEEEISADHGLDERTIQENRRMMSQKKGGKKTPKSPNPKSPGKEGKKPTNWDSVVFGGKISKEAERQLDRTVGKPGDQPDLDIHLDQYVPNKALVGKSATLEDVEYEDVSVEEGSGKSGGGMFSMFTNLVGSKPLTREDLEPVLAKLKDNLIAKNVASEVAESLTESVMLKLEGGVMGTFQSLARHVKEALTQSLMKLLTPKRRIDILRDVMDARDNRKPYVITFCGVNGVGKSTNLAKICFWLIENKFSVLIAACDTFRAGAVEQLRTHTKRLNSLHPAEQNKGKQMVQLYEKGYGKDAAGIAMEAINYARDCSIDVVLVDTAGRMQDNEPLMRALSKLISGMIGHWGDI